MDGRAAPANRTGGGRLGSAEGLRERAETHWRTQSDDPASSAKLFFFVEVILVPGTN